MDDIPSSTHDASPQSPEFTNTSRHTELLNFLTNSTSLRTTAKSSLKQSLYAGSGAFAGSFLGGPIGGLLGGVVGSIVGYKSSNDYDGAIVAIRGLEVGRRDELIKVVGGVLAAAGASVGELSTLEGYRESLVTFAEQEEVRNSLWEACVNSVRG